MRPLRFALAQGLLLNDALAALRAIGVDVSGITPGGRRLVVAGGEIEFVLARPSDIRGKGGERGDPHRAAAHVASRSTSGAISRRRR